MKPKAITEIFATNPGLLETPEVKELMNQWKYQSEQVMQSLRNARIRESEIMEALMLDETMLFDGRESKETVNIVFQIITTRE